MKKMSKKAKSLSSYTSGKSPGLVPYTCHAALKAVKLGCEGNVEHRGNGSDWLVFHTDLVLMLNC